MPDCCTPETLPELIELLPKIHVLSPNASELLAFFGHSRALADQNEEKGVSDTISAEYKTTIEALALELAEKSDGKTNVVVRCGALGSFHVPSSSEQQNPEKVGKWLPAYHTSQHKVVDPTGAGNAFCGAVAVALTKGLGIDEAVMWGNVAAGFVVEQTGLPVLKKVEDYVEKWNDESVRERLEEYRTRTLKGI